MLNIRTVLVLLGVILITLFVKWFFSRKSVSSQKPLFEHRPLPTHEESVYRVSVPAIPSQKISIQRDDPPKHFKDRLRERKMSGASLAAALSSVMTEFGSGVAMDDVLLAAAEVGYPAGDIAAFMFGRQYKAKDVAELLVKDDDATLQNVATIIMPHVEGDSTVARAENAFVITKDAYVEYSGYQLDEDDEAVVGLPAQLGCSLEESAMILHQNTDMSLGKIVRELKLASSPLLVAKVAEAVDVDLSDEEQYADLREDDDIQFTPAACILKACGKSAEDIILAEDRDDEFGDDDIDVIFTDLRSAGFSNEEILHGLNESQIIENNPLATILLGAIGQNIPMEEIVTFLVKDDIDAGDLDEEMRDADATLAERIDLVHALLHATRTVQEDSPVLAGD